MRSEYLKRFKQQIGFLNRSCDSFDAGHEDEAIRIAVTLRVLLHDTQASTSLLKHLDALNISLLSTVPDQDAKFAALGPNERLVTFGGLFRTRIDTATGVSLHAALDDGIAQYPVSITKWLNQIVASTMDNVRVTRRNIILGAANKDGGAHVDLNFPTEYQVASGDSPLGYLWTRSGVSTQNVIEKTHLVSLRQMGHEILNSPDVQALSAEP